MTTLRNPPVVEIWIGFRLEPNDAAPKWTERSAASFFDGLEAEFPELEFEGEQNVSFVPGTARTPPKVRKIEVTLKKVQAINAAKSRSLQLANGLLVYAALRSDDPYPGFEQLLSESFRMLTTYVERYEPKSVRSAAVFYRDHVSIPCNGPLTVKDYFRHVTEYPAEPFGNILHFSHQTTFDSPKDKGPLFHSIQPLPRQSGDPFLFELKWLKECQSIDSLDMGIIKTRLIDAHDYLFDCFKQSFSDLAWQFFD